MTTEKRPGLARNEREVSVHQDTPPQGKKTEPIQEPLIDNRGPHDTPHDINEHRRCKHSGAEVQGYNAHRRGRYDSDEDRMALEPRGP